MWKCLTCVLLLCCACVASPRSEASLRAREEAIAFSGLLELPDEELQLQAFDYDKGAWVRFGAARTRKDGAVIDETGRPYFRYETSAVLPQAPAFWAPEIDKGRIEARVRVVHGTRVLTLFGQDAEACVRAAHARGQAASASLHGCAQDGRAYSRLVVPACGGVGEPCCPAPPACAAASACEAGVCRALAYAPPLVTGYQVDLATPAGYAVRDAWLVLDDTAGQRDSTRALVRAGRASPGVMLGVPHPAVARLRFDLPLWKPGRNRFHVRALASKGAATRVVESAMQQLGYELPRGLGLREPGVLSLPAATFPRAMQRCGAGACKDRDGDGLSDLWENVALHQLRPRLLLDHADGLFRRKHDVVRVLTSVMPLLRDGRQHVLFASVIAFSRDYGHLGGFGHPGDTEAFGMLFRVEDDDQTLRWVASAAKGHACLTCAPAYRFARQEFDDQGAPLLFVEGDKHGLWQDGRSCRASAAFRCRGDRSLRPDAVNVGDLGEGGPRPLIDALDGVDPRGVFGGLAGVFPGDAIWTAARARVAGRFCGGQRGCSRDDSASQPGAVIASLVRLFARASW